MSLDVRPTILRTAPEQLAECERMIRHIRAIQRAHEQCGRVDATRYAGDRVDVLLAVWAHLNQLCEPEAVPCP